MAKRRKKTVYVVTSIRPHGQEPIVQVFTSYGDALLWKSLHERRGYKVTIDSTVR